MGFNSGFKGLISHEAEASFILGNCSFYTWTRKN